jgi:hypothetical protein
MKKFCILVVAFSMTGIFVPVVFAKGGGKGKGAKAPAAQTVTSEAYAKYDLDNNAVLSTDEIANMNKDLSANKDDTLLKPFDTNNDGKLSTSEIAAIPITKTTEAEAPAKKGKGKGKKK